MAADGTAPEPAEVAPARPAATVIVVRDAPGAPTGIETLMLRRSSIGAFGGMWVFPGGKVDPGDDDPDAPGDELAAARRAAAREAAEEAAITVDPTRLVPFSHWTPPTFAPKRYATWFFVGTALGEVVVDGGEIHDHGWMAPTEAMARHAAGEIELAPPTWVTLHQLAIHETVDGVLAAAAAATPERFLTMPARDGATTVLVWHGDAGYETGDASATGPRHRLIMEPGGWRYERFDPPGR